MSVTVYLDTWASPWTADPTKMDLANLYAGIDCINLAFASPTSTYKKGTMSFSGTGLNFAMDFTVVQQAIAIAKKSGTRVLLSVGGATYQFRTADPYANYQNLIDLCNDLGCDGIDLDWEPNGGGASVDYAFGWIIQGFKQAGAAYLTAACTGNGVLPITDPVNDGYRGMNLKGLTLQGKNLDAVNVMAYDAGKFDAVASYNQYRKVYAGQLNLGFELGPQSWGSYVTTIADVTTGCNGVQADRLLGNKGGVFIWCYHKDTTGSPTDSQTISIAKSILVSTSSPPPPLPNKTCCPYCPCQSLPK